VSGRPFPAGLPLLTVSVPVELAELAKRIEEFGSVAYLFSVNPDGLPHVVAVRASWDDDALSVGAGKRTSSNVATRPNVTLLWPARPGEGYSLIVDGTARPAPEERLTIAPTGAVLHRTPEGDPSAPSCVTVLPRTLAD
jgi:pyridoxamine 5'-phosphate oxidase-like protein